MNKLGNKPVDQINTIRTRVAEINDSIEALRWENQSTEESLSDIDKFIERRAEQFDCSLSAFCKPAGTAGFYCEHIPLIDGAVMQTDVSAMACALFPDVVRDYMTKKFKEKHGDNAGRNMSDRPSILKKLETERLKLEISEEQLIVELETQGIEFDRRADFYNVLAIITKPEAA